MAHSAMAFPGFTTRPCKWYFVEMIDGEFDEEQEEASSSASNTASERMRCDANDPVHTLSPGANFDLTERSLFGRAHR